MQPLNAIDAISPAFTRTHETLFRPFRFGRSWKLAASQYLGWCGAMFVPFPLFFLLFPTNSIPGLSALHGAFIVMGVISTIIALVLLYFFARMEMVCFEMMLTRGKFIAPMWRRYSVRIWPWLGFKIVLGTIYGAIVFALFYAPARHVTEQLFSSFPAITPGEKPDPAAMQVFLAGYMQHITGMQFLFGAMALVLKIPSTLLNDFVLPFYILEDISLTEALRRGLNVVLADPLQCLLYLILKPILFIIGYIMQNIALGIASIPFLIVFLIAIGIGAVSVSHSGAGGGLFLGAGAITIIAISVVCFVYLTLFVAGYLVALLEALGIYFLGGRYPLLGNILEPGPGAPFTPPPVFPSNEERKNNGGGPPMPMDPAVA